MQNTQIEFTNWPSRVYQQFSNTVLAPIHILQQKVDEKALKYLSVAQLELVYSILKAIPLALAISFLPPLVVLGAFIGILIIDVFKPDIFSKKTWTLISLACGFSGLINAGISLTMLIRTGNIWNFVFFGLEVLGSAIAFVRASVTFDDYITYERSH